MECHTTTEKKKNYGNHTFLILSSDLAQSLTRVQFLQNTVLLMPKSITKISSDLSIVSDGIE